jgi:hypothetical protein
VERFKEVIYGEEEPLLHPDNRYFKMLRQMRENAWRISVDEILDPNLFDRLIEGLKEVTRESFEVWTKHKSDYRILCLSCGVPR